MIPSLVGRLQTRLFSMGTVALLWTLFYVLVTPVGLDDGIYVLAGATVLGLCWEFLYQAYQNTRWDKDFPSGLFLMMGFAELVPVLALGSILDLPLGHVTAHFLIAFLLVFLFIQGPIRVIIPRWRFRAGRIW